MAYIAHVVPGVWCGEVGRCDARVFVLFVSSRSGIVSNSNAGAITDHSQSAKDKDPYFKSLFYTKDTGHRKPVHICLNGLSTPGDVGIINIFIIVATKCA